jgi:hypothetical protein
MTKGEREEKIQMCAPDDQTEEGVFGTEGINAVTNNENRHRTEKEEKKKRCVQQLVLYLNARYNGEGKCTEEEEEEASREREREREGGRWRLEERRPALRTERRRRRR